METMQTRQERKKSHKKKKIRPFVWIILGCSTALAGAITFCAITQPWLPQKPAAIISENIFPEIENAQDGLLPDMTEEEMTQQMQKLADASSFSYKINARPEFADGSSAGILSIENPNYNVYPITVNIVLDQTGEEVYSSGGILPNQHIYEAALSKVLPKGIYPATAVINMFDPDTKEQLGRTEAGISITVLN